MSRERRAFSESRDARLRALSAPRRAARLGNPRLRKRSRRLVSATFRIFGGLASVARKRTSLLTQRVRDPIARVVTESCPHLDGDT